MNAQNYRDNVLVPIVVPIANEMRPNFILMHDNARPHRARIITTFLQDHQIDCMEWPAMSPDLNPIENIWAILGTRVRNHDPPISTVPELTRALQREWTNIDQVVIRNTVLTMRRRCIEWIGVSGASMHY